MKQLKVFQQMTMFEQRILCRKLPKSLDKITVESADIQNPNEHNKVIKDMKRQTLHHQLQQYEMDIQKHDKMFERELITFEFQQSKTASSSIINTPIQDTSINVLKKYLTQQTNSLIRKIRYKERCFYTKLLRHHHSYSHSSLLSKETVDVYPQVIVDIPKIYLSPQELDYFQNLYGITRTRHCYSILFRTKLYQTKSNLPS
jgi:hypothetical protein